MDVCLGADGPGQEAEVAQTLGRSFFDPKIRAGLLLRVGPELTLLLRAAAYLLLPAAMGIALLPVAAVLSPRETDSKTNLPKGILRPERAAKQLLLEEEAISKIYLVGRRGLVTVKNALDFHAHREFSTPLIDIE